jgi:filamentous hemagglutinin
MIDKANPAAAGFAVYGCCSVASAASFQHGFGFRFGHVPAGDPVVIVRGNGDMSVPVVDAEQDLVVRQEASVFEHGIGDLHPGKGHTPVVFVRVVSFKRDGNARDVFVACATWFKIGISHGQLPYASVEEQSGIHAGTDGFDITVKGNTDLKGALIASDADADRNTLNTGTLSFSDLKNHSDYTATSTGISAGVTAGSGGNNDATTGQTSGKDTGGALPTFANDSGSSDATTRSAISAGTINVTDGANQEQDIASLSRDTSRTNGTVSKLPDVNQLVNNQADLMNAVTAASAAVAQRIGDYADSKYREAEATGDQAGMDAWKDGGNSRAELQAAGAAVVGGLGSGGIGGAAVGAAIASKSAGKLDELSQPIADSSPTGNADLDKALGNIVANVAATGIGGVGGAAGATAGSAVDRFNRQLHPEEKAVAKQLADKSGGLYSQAQIEDQMRIMGATSNGTNESGAPTTLIGQAPTDSGAQWMSAGTTADGKPILTQITAQANLELQSYILSNSATDVPGTVSYDPLSRSRSSSITGPFTKFDKSDADFMRNTTTDAAGMVSTNAGRVSSLAAAGASITPCSVVCEGIAYGGPIIGIAADAVGQLAKPNTGQYLFNGSTSIASNYISAASLMLAPAVNELVNQVNGSGVAMNVQEKIDGIFGPQTSKGKK